MSVDNAALLAAHETRDVPVLSGLYERAGRAAIAQGDIDQGCFFLTHAYVFALEAGLDSARDIHAILKSHDREE